MMLYLINSVGPQIAKKLLWLTYQSTMAMTLKCYPGELKTGEVYHVHLICMCIWFYTFHFRADNAVTVVYKPPNTTLFGKAVETKLKVASGRTQWFKGQISNYDGLGIQASLLSYSTSIVSFCVCINRKHCIT